MATSKIKYVHSCKPYSNDKGTIYYHSLTMEDGVEINIGKKKELKVGEELTYELTGGDDGQQRFKKAKTPSQPMGGGFQKSPEQQDAILYQTCLKIASEVFVAQSGTSHEIKPKDLNDFAYELAKGAKSNIKLLKDA